MLYIAKLFVTLLRVCIILNVIYSLQLLPGLISLLEVTQDASKILVVNKLISFIEVCLHNDINLNCKYNNSIIIVSFV